MLSSFAWLVSFPFSLCLVRWIWPFMMNMRHVHTPAVCIFLWHKGPDFKSVQTSWSLHQSSALTLHLPLLPDILSPCKSFSLSSSMAHHTLAAVQGMVASVGASSKWLHLASLPMKMIISFGGVLLLVLMLQWWRVKKRPAIEEERFGVELPLKYPRWGWPFVMFWSEARVAAPCSCFYWFSPVVTPSCWLGSEHQLTNLTNSDWSISGVRR